MTLSLDVAYFIGQTCQAFFRSLEQATHFHATVWAVFTLAAMLLIRSNQYCHWHHYLPRVWILVVYRKALACVGV